MEVENGALDDRFPNRWCSISMMTPGSISPVENDTVHYEYRTILTQCAGHAGQRNILQSGDGFNLIDSS